MPVSQRIAIHHEPTVRSCRSRAFRIEITQPALPKGGGAITGIGETFQLQEFTGTAALSVPIPTSPCRDFEPRLSIDYRALDLARMTERAFQYERNTDVSYLNVNGWDGLKKGLLAGEALALNLNQLGTQPAKGGQPQPGLREHLGRHR